MQSYKVESFFAMIQNGVERSFHLKRKKPGDLMTSRNILKQENKNTLYVNIQVNASCTKASVIYGVSSLVTFCLVSINRDNTSLRWHLWLYLVFLWYRLYYADISFCSCKQHLGLTWLWSLAINWSVLYRFNCAKITFQALTSSNWFILNLRN